MGVSADFFTRLNAAAEIQAAVGLDASGVAKVYNPPVPQTEALPFLVARRIPQTSTHHYGGASSFCATRFRVDCFAASALAAHTVAEAVREVCDGYSGLMGSTNVYGMFVEDLRDDVLDPADGSETFDHWIPVEVLVQHARSVPSPV